MAVRLGDTVRTASDLALLLRIGWFVVRLPIDVERSHLEAFLVKLERAPRPPAADPRAGAERVARLRRPWLRLPGLRSRDTCYVRALTVYRFLDPGKHDVRLRVGVEWHDRVGGVGSEEARDEQNDGKQRLNGRFHVLISFQLCPPNRQAANLFIHAPPLERSLGGHTRCTFSTPIVNAPASESGPTKMLLERVDRLVLNRCS